MDYIPEINKREGIRERGLPLMKASKEYMPKRKGQKNERPLLVIWARRSFLSRSGSARRKKYQVLGVCEETHWFWKTMKKVMLHRWRDRGELYWRVGGWQGQELHHTTGFGFISVAWGELLKHNCWSIIQALWVLYAERTVGEKC